MLGWLLCILSNVEMRDGSCGVFGMLQSNTISCEFVSTFFPLVWKIIYLVLLVLTAIRIVTNSSYHAHTAPLFAKHKILPLNKIILQAKLHLMHSIHYNYAPPTLKYMCQKNSSRAISHNLRNQDDYTIPRANYTFFTRFPLYTLPIAWNSAGIVTFYIQHSKLPFLMNFMNPMSPVS